MSQEFGLGRGLSSLIPQKNTHASSTHDRQSGDAMGDDATKVAKKVSQSRTQNGVCMVRVADIVPNPHQPRLVFDKEKLAELTASIKEHGILQPLVVTKRVNGTYEIIAGERRFRAAQDAGLREVPVIVRQASARDKMELALIENVQRHDLNLIEEAKAYQALAQTYKLSQEEIAQRVGKSRSVVANRLRLLTLPVTILKAVSDGTISEGHAKVILSLDNTEAQHALFKMIVQEHLTVRQAEVRAQKALSNGDVTHTRRSVKQNVPPVVSSIQKELAEALDARVKIVPRGRGGRVIIDYYASEDLRILAQKICECSKNNEK